MKKLLVVAHTPSDNTRKLLEAVLEGTRHPSICEVTVKEVAPLHAVVEDVMECDAIILGTTENLGYMSGALKDFISLYTFNINILLFSI